MMNKSPLFKQADVKRAAAGATAAGLDVSRIEIDREGKIIIHTGDQKKHPESPLDAWKRKRNEG